jgi:ribosomal protein S18 acetylase RimI-like enzyme
MDYFEIGDRNVVQDNIVIEPATESIAEKIPELVFSTAPAVYDHIFLQDRELFDNFVRTSWASSASTYGFLETTIAREGDELLGIEIGYGGERYYELQEHGSPVGQTLLKKGQVTSDQLKAVGKESYKSSFQIPFIPPDAYYVLALAVTENSRGKGIGAGLLENAFGTAKQAGFRTLHLDVMSDNPAVDFYKRMGMTCMAETVSPLLIDQGIPAEYRMVKPLG